MNLVSKTSDVDIFTTLQEEAIEVCTLLLVMRDFASEMGRPDDIEKINSTINENKDILGLINDQLSDLSKNENTHKMGLFDTFWAA